MPNPGATNAGFSLGTHVRNPFIQLSTLALIGAVVIGLGSSVASRRAGESEAMTEARAMTSLVAKSVVEPNLTTALFDADRQAIDDLDEIVQEFVLTGTTVRVKVWDADGRIVYSDEPRLIGEVYELGRDQNTSLWSGEVTSDISSLEGPENRFEIDQGSLLEVYLPLEGPNGEPLLYESYFAMSAVDDANARIRSEFAPIIVGSLGLMFTLHLLLAWTLNRRLRRGQAERERLLERAIRASNLERRRVAADLHDGVVQDLVATSLSVEAAADAAADASPQLANDLRAASLSTRTSLQSLRSLLVDIYPPNLKTHGLAAALHDLVAPATSVGIETELNLTADDSLTETDAELIYRVAREATRNAMRHSDASKLQINVESGGGSVTATIADDGHGFRPAEGQPEGHLGLRVLSDLAADADAKLSICSRPGEGTTLTLEIPR